MLDVLENPGILFFHPLPFQNAAILPPLLSAPWCDGDDFLSLNFLPLSYNDEDDRLDSEIIPISSVAEAVEPP